MNADPRNFWRQSQKPLLCAGAGLLLAACVELPKTEPFANAPVDPLSPAAAEVISAAATRGPWPTFESIPEIPTDVRSPGEWRQAVMEVEGARDQLLAETAPQTFVLHDTEAFAAGVIAEADVRPGDVPTDAEIAASEAFARGLRERATPPPRPR